MGSIIIEKQNNHRHFSSQTLKKPLCFVNGLNEAKSIAIAFTSSKGTFSHSQILFNSRLSRGLLQSYLFGLQSHAGIQETAQKWELIHEISASVFKRHHLQVL